MYNNLAQDLPPAFSGRNVSNMRAHNLQTILLTLLYSGSQSRVRMAELTGLSTTTITTLVAELLEHGIVAEEAPILGLRSGAGRPRTPIRLVPEARQVIGIHVDVDHIRIGLTDLYGTIMANETLALSVGDAPERVLKETADAVRRVIAAAGVSTERILGVGVGASGLVDSSTGYNMLAPSLEWRNVPVRDLLANELDLPIFVDNNVRAMALGETMFGAGRRVNSLAFVYAGIGVGAGFIVDGRVYRGSQAGAGEIGHTTIVPVGGQRCRCGNTGCLETLVSEPALLAQAHTAAKRDPGSLLAQLLSEHQDDPMTAVFAAAKQDDPAAVKMLADCAEYTGIALANLINIVNPDMIILGGFFSAGGDSLLRQVEATMRRRAFGGLGTDVALRLTTFGRKAGIIGAAALALDAFFYRRPAV